MHNFAMPTLASRFITKNKTGKKYVLHIPTQEGMNYDPRKTVPHEHKWVID